MQLKLLHEDAYPQADEATLDNGVTLKIGQWFEYRGWPVQVVAIKRYPLRNEWLIKFDDSQLPDASRIAHSDRKKNRAPWSEIIGRYIALDFEIGNNYSVLKPISDIEAYAKEKNFQW